MEKRLLSIFIAVCLIFSSFALSAFAEPGDFSDMPGPGHWAYEALKAAAENGILKGSGGRIKPFDNLTRAEMAAVINNAFGTFEKADISAFSDVPAGSWYAGEIGKALAMKSFAGSGSLMRPEDPVTRQEAFTVLAKVFKLADGSAASLAAFGDAADVGSWAVGKLAALCEAGYVSGSNGMLKPLAPISRAEFAQIMHNMIQVYISEPGTYTELAEGNIMVNVPGVVLKDLEVKGDVIVGDGVGNGDLTLDNVKIGGRLVVRGGGENSIIIINGSSVGNIVVSKSSDGGVRVRTSQGCSVEVVYMDDGRDDVILQGEFNSVIVESDVKVILKDAEVTSLSLAAEGSNVSLEGESKVTSVDIGKDAEGSRLSIGKDSSVAALNSSAEGASIGGKGKLESANVSGNNTSVNTVGTNLAVAENTSGVEENGKSVDGGETVVTSDQTGASGAGGGGGADPEPPAPLNPTPFAVLKDDELGVAADIRFATLAEAMAKAGEIKDAHEDARPRIAFLKDAVLKNVALPADYDYAVRGANVSFEGVQLAGFMDVEAGGKIINKGALKLLYSEQSKAELWVRNNAELINRGSIEICGDLDGGMRDNARLLISGGSMRNEAGASVLNNGRFGMVAGAALTNPGRIDTHNIMFFGGSNFVNETSGVMNVEAGSLVFEAMPNIYVNDGGNYVQDTVGAFSGMVNKGTINNKAYISLEGGTYVNNGTINNTSTYNGPEDKLPEYAVYGAMLTLAPELMVTETEDGDNIDCTVESLGECEFTNKGVIDNKGYILALARIVNDSGGSLISEALVDFYDWTSPLDFCYWLNYDESLTDEQRAAAAEEALDAAEIVMPEPSFVNRGTLLLKSGNAPFGYFYQQSGLMTNTGSLVNNSELIIYKLAFTSSGRLENYGRFAIYACELNVSSEFVNEGDAEAQDRFYDGGGAETRNLLCEGVEQMRARLAEGSNEIYFSARAYSEDAVWYVHNLQIASLPEPDRVGDGKYTGLHMMTDLSIDEDTEFSYFRDYLLFPHYTEEGEVSSTLTVNATLTLGHGYLHVEGWSDAGPSRLVIASGGAIHTLGSTEIPGENKNRLLDNGHVGFGTYSEFVNNGTVTNDGMFHISYEEDEDGSLFRSGDVAGIGGEVSRDALVRSQGGFNAAITANCTDIYLVDGCEVSIAADINEPRHISLEPGCSLVVNGGVSWTISDVHFENHGDVSVYGNLIMNNVFFENFGGVEVGDVGGSNNAAITFSGEGENARFENHDLVQIRATGKFTVNSPAQFIGNAPQINDGGEFNGIVTPFGD